MINLQTKWTCNKASIKFYDSELQTYCEWPLVYGTESAQQSPIVTNNAQHQFIEWQVQNSKASVPGPHYDLTTDIE
jgi:hypothetical protein